MRMLSEFRKCLSCDCDNVVCKEGDVTRDCEICIRNSKMADSAQTAVTQHNYTLISYINNIIRSTAFETESVLIVTSPAPSMVPFGERFLPFMPLRRQLVSGSLCRPASLAVRSLGVSFNPPLLC
ncbi:hypothetical protein TNCV_339131 [Trichonephila clavipes]|nr:hypothetical protein TNCV_339131 [Trichonephila clavipes]